ncbi:MAG TPA: cytochrome-c oxidase, cbb3-type subunit III [Alcanivoracaceae bacterium]|nr:cytochrome-c oxidase, cbb3-type subunit III [Alcanivoracaceae bacterium]
MNNFWSGWVMALVAINYITILVLFLWAPRAKIPSEPDGTTGHTWAHGTIREGLGRLPTWWLILSTAAFIAAFIYLVRYPGFGSYEGTLQWTSKKEMLEQRAITEEKMQPLWQRIEDTPILALGEDEQAMRMAKRLFDDNCAACHGYDGKGVQAIGAPDLTDRSWQFGGSVAAVQHSISKGRKGVMPPLGGTLKYGQIKNVAHYVLSLAGRSHEAPSATAGEKVFKQYCFACHGMDGTGNQALGAPNLTEDAWKFGDTLEDIMYAVEHGRKGEMPAWEGRLRDTEIKLLTSWVLSHDNTNEVQVSSP